MNSLIWGMFLTLLPLIELRGGLPFVLVKASENNIPHLLIFLFIISLNILLIFLIFFFLDHLHNFLLRYEFYGKFYNLYLKKMQKRIKNFEKAHKSIGLYALFFLVAIPLPPTGSYTGSFLSWSLGLDRKKSIISISLGILVAGIIIYLITEGILIFLA